MLHLKTTALIGYLVSVSRVTDLGRGVLLPHFPQPCNHGWWGGEPDQLPWCTTIYVNKRALYTGWGKQW